MNKKGKETRPIPFKKETLKPDQLQEGYVFEVPREGVHVHSFICQHCGLHFLVFSWQFDRHRVENTYCPECGKRGAFMHYRRVLSENPQFSILSNAEIFRYVPFHESNLINDSVKRMPDGSFRKLEINIDDE